MRKVRQEHRYTVALLYPACPQKVSYLIGDFIHPSVGLRGVIQDEEGMIRVVPRGILKQLCYWDQ